MCVCTYLEWSVLSLCSHAEVQRDVAMLSLSGVRVKYQRLLLPRVGDGAKRIEHTPHEVIPLVDGHFSKIPRHGK